jgi:hypothetical protein
VFLRHAGESKESIDDVTIKLEGAGCGGGAGRGEREEEEIERGRVEGVAQPAHRDTHNALLALADDLHMSQVTNRKRKDYAGFQYA